MESREYSTTYHPHFFGLLKPKEKQPKFPQHAFATRGIAAKDPFSKHRRQKSVKVDGDGYHTIRRHKRATSSMGNRANPSGNKFFQKKLRHRKRSPGLEDRKIFGKYQRMAKKTNKAK
jgi:hypothetical protein